VPKLINNRIGAEYYVVADPTTIGRHPSNYIVLPGTRISRFHAKIGTADGEHFIRDLGSTYGTFLNGRRIDCKGDTLLRLKHGDRILLGVSSDCPSGEYEVTFSTEEVPEGAAWSIRQIISKRQQIEPGRVSFEDVGKVVIVHLSGAFRGPECDALVNHVVSHISSEPRHVVLDLGGIEHVNSYALGTFVRLRLDLGDMGLESTLAEAKGHVLQLVEIMGLAPAFGSYPTVQQAVDSLRERLGASET
jgi:anti-anti-sigma factor